MSARVLAIAGVLVAMALAAGSGLGLDYQADAGPAISALARGDVHGFFAATPQMGPLSLVARAPLAAIAPNDLWAYRAGSLLCLLALVALLVGIVRGRSVGVALAAGAALLLGGPTLESLRLGHPEGLLLAALCVAAVLLAPRRPLLAAVALGAALATKQTALIAIAPVLLAAPAGARRRVGLTAGGIAAAVVVPPALVAPHAFLASLQHPAFGLAAMRTGNPWVAFADQHRIALGPDSVTSYVVPAGLRTVAHPAIALLTVAGGALLAWRRRGTDALVLLALLFLLRCALDPWDHGYYHVGFLAALTAWEIRSAGRIPWLACVSGAWLAFVFRLPIANADLAYLAWAMPVGLYLWRRLQPAPSAARAGPRHAAEAVPATR